MLRPRIIPCLLVQDGRLVKTQQFKEPKYVGDPLNAVRIFNEKEVDELFVADISATVGGRSPDYSLIEAMAHECRMPLCYAGGVRDAEQIERIISLGVEKVGVSSAACANVDVIRDSAVRVGTQSVVAILDVKRDSSGTYQVHTHNGRTRVGMTVQDAIAAMQDAGAGEIVVNSIDRDGMQDGYDWELIGRVRPLTRVPLTVLGGAGSLDHLRRATLDEGASGAAAGSLFVFKGRFRAVLITYPSCAQMEATFADAGTAHATKP